MNQRVIAVTGISGVGKTTLLRKLTARAAFQHLTGGSLIARAHAGTNLSRDGLRHFDLDDNQKLLIEGFMAARDRTAETVIFDGHAVIDGPNGLAEIPISVFDALGIRLMVHLEADLVTIQRNRGNDPSRSRPALDIQTLREHQSRSRRHAITIAQALNVECLVLHNEDASILEARLSA